MRGRAAEVISRPIPIPLSRRSGRSPTTPTILPRPLAGGQLKRAAVHPVDNAHLVITDFHALHQSGYELPLHRPVRAVDAIPNTFGKSLQVADDLAHLLELCLQLFLRLRLRLEPF